MEDLRKSVLTSLDGKNDDLYPYLPYLLQDLWEMGTSAEIIINLVKKHRINHSRDVKVLDLGCGKGAISINLAKTFGFHVHGIDGMPEFIKDANMWTEKYDVSHLCRFEIGDIRLLVNQLEGYDIIILGSIGPVFGNIEETLRKAMQCLRKNGIVILDDGYIPEDSKIKLRHYPTRSEALIQIQNSHFDIIEEHMIDQNYIKESNAAIFESIHHRVMELKSRYPKKSYLFEQYLKTQEEENDILENYIRCVTWLLRKDN